MGDYSSMEDVDKINKIGKVVVPNPANRDRYDDLYAEYRATYDALVPIYKRLYQVR
jgi:sugar (pentulose or hexulose) kinase